MSSNTFPQVDKTYGPDNHLPGISRIHQITIKLISFPKSIYETLSTLLLYLIRVVHCVISRTLNLAAFESAADDDNSRLSQVWNEPDKSSVIFISIDLGFSCHAENSISSIGLSWWCLDGLYDIRSYYWEVKEDLGFFEPVQPHSIGSFVFGTTKLIKRSEIGLSLSHMFDWLATNHGIICLVGHEIIVRLRHLEPYWSIPNNVRIFDTERIWQTQHRESAPISLEECMKRTPSLAASHLTQDNAGNNAHMVIELLKCQGTSSELTRDRINDRKR